MFADVRKRLLPGLIREHYRTARAALDAKDAADAEAQFGEVRRMIDEAEKVNAIDDTLADMRVLVDGFLDLARTSRTLVAPSPASQPSSPPDADIPSKSQPPAAPTIFDSSAPGVTAPVAIHQEVPGFPLSLLTIVKTDVTKGTLEVLIDENGNVERSVMRDSVNPIYDGLVVRASKTWKYRPALMGDTPVKYVKLIAINIQR